MTEAEPLDDEFGPHELDDDERAIVGIGIGGVCAVAAGLVGVVLGLIEAERSPSLGYANVARVGFLALIFGDAICAYLLAARWGASVQAAATTAFLGSGAFLLVGIYAGLALGT